MPQQVTMEKITPQELMHAMFHGDDEARTAAYNETKRRLELLETFRHVWVGELNSQAAMNPTLEESQCFQG